MTQVIEKQKSAYDILVEASEAAEAVRDTGYMGCYPVGSECAKKSNPIILMKMRENKMRLTRITKGYYIFKNYYIFRYKGMRNTWWSVGLQNEGEFDVSLEGFPSLREARNYIMVREDAK